MLKLTTDIPPKTAALLKNGFHLQLLFKNQISGTVEPRSTISSQKLSEERNILDLTLGDLRKVLAKQIDAKWAFCLENGAPVEDSNGLCYYLTLSEPNTKMLQGPPKKKEEKKDEKKDENKDEKKDEEPHEPISLPLLSAYMAVAGSMAPAIKGFGMDWAEKHPANLTLTDRSKEELAVPAVPSSYKAAYLSDIEWKDSSRSPDEKGMLDCVVDLPQVSWDTLMMLNKVLYGFDLRGKRIEVTSARVPAFELKTLDEQPQTARVHLREFVEVYDTPHIDIAEVSTDFQSSLVDNAFSARSLETMIGGATPLISASVSAGIKTESSKASGINEGSKRMEYHATYNFPRVRFFLDEHTLTVSEHCKQALIELRNSPTLESLRQFQRRFGVIFAQEVTMGGRLECTKSADSSFNAENSAAKDALKASLGAAVSGGMAFASASASTESQGSQKKEQSKTNGASAASYTARGGNTLLCANPSAWVSSVAVWRNWRIIQQDEPVTVQELLGRFEAYKWVPDLFDKILAPTRPVQPAPNPNPDKIFDKNIPWKNTTKLRLWVGQDSVPLATFYTVRDGNPDSESAPPRESLLADYPLLLFEGDAPTHPGRDAHTVYVDRSTGALGPQTAKRGPCRFSLRKVGSSGQWKPLASEKILNGEKVTMWCHSLGSGPWTSLNQAPTQAYQAFWNSESKTLEFDTPKATHSAVGGAVAAELVVEYI
ncbi:hypothetical protein F1880_002090 [Penicillium rolfsii]|nr:hypothetical protein F1880_002090 [Penicillium rolfsii]